MTSAVLETALSYLDAGLSVIPVRANGTKAPLLPDWRQFGARRATRAEAAAWWHPDVVCGIGITGGAASGNLGVLDFEAWAAYLAWLRSLPPHLEALTRRCPLVQCPRGGAHLYARMTDPVPGMVLARHVPDPHDVDERTGRPKARTLIEVRGDGHQVVAPGSPAQCHPENREYEWLRRGWLDSAVTAEPIELEDWFAWLEHASALNQVERDPAADRPVAPPKPRPTEAGIRPGDDFNSRGTWEEAGLLAAGWTWFLELDGDRGFVTRPGKSRKDGKSGTLGLVSAKDGGHPLFYAFTSDCAPFEPQQGYSRFRVYALLKHNGDHVAAARALGQKGYGSPARGARAGVSAGGTPAVTNEGGDVTADQPGEPSDEAPPANNPGVKPPLPIVYFADIKPNLNAADFVEGLLIDGAMSVIYGDSGSGKTFFMLDLALHVAGGIPWRGREVERRGVLYLALEGSHGISNRVAAYKEANKSNAADLAFAIVPVTVDLLSPDGDVARVIEAAKSFAAHMSVPVGMIIVDTLARAIAGGNENSPEDMGALVRNLDLIRQALPSHVAAVHHSGKDSARGARGHSSLRAATDTEIEVSRDEGEKLSVARVTKQRELELGDEFAYRLSAVDLGRDRRGKPVVSCVVFPTDADGLPTKEDRAAQREQAREREKLQKQRDQDARDRQSVLKAVDDEVTEFGTPGAGKSAIEDRASCSKARVKVALDWLLERGELVAIGPFKKPSGNGAMISVPGGYARVKMDDDRSE